jgi:hypothetical protein
METFLDGGIFEIIIAIFFAGLINFIFLKKYLLIIYSLLIIAGPALLFFINKNDFYYWLVTVCLFNAVLLVILLWKTKIANAGETLFNIESMKNKLSVITNKFSSAFKKEKRPG